MPVPPADFLPLQNALAGEYVIESELGRGGMGIVYLARDVGLERSVAIKVLPPAYAVRPELRERFLREARTAAKLSHPNVVPVHRAEEVGGFVFFVMAFVDGETLGQRVRGRGPLTAPQAARLIREVAWALAYAHARGVVHRDVKPDNILIERDTGRALVTDFGIALRSDIASITDEGQVMGTAQFMSPEQAAGEALDGRSDLYSLGVVSYFALTANLPFDGPTVQSILAKHLTQPPPSLRGHPGVPDALAVAVDRCLSKTPTERWATGEALADTIGDATPATHVVPAPIRVWLTKGRWMGPLALVWYFFWTIGLLDGDFLNLATLIAGVLPALGFCIVDGALVRRALDAGFGYEDLLAGLRQEMEERREERLFDVGREPPLAFKVIRWATYAAWSIIAGLLGTLLLAPVSEWDPATIIAFAEAYASPLSWVVLTAFAGSAFGMLYPGRRLSGNDWLASLRWRFWHGPIGRTLVKLAGSRGTARTHATSTHRPTEIAIGLAAQDLYDALPRELQRRFRTLPRLLRHLEDEAQNVRTKLTALAATEHELASSHASAEDKARLVEELRAARAEDQERLTTTVAALEAIRLDLLRLSAGVGDADSLTTAIAAAERLGSGVDRLVRRST
jgi:predicted Ser/Thr protein kinase